MPSRELQRSDQFVVSTRVRSRQLDNDLILLDLRQGEYFTLNPTGADVWKGLERGLELGALDSEISTRWPVDAEERWRLLTEIVLDLLDRGLVERRG
jgi:Coenzyme PQQ synthesis protein D (PqqD)